VRTAARILRGDRQSVKCLIDILGKKQDLFVEPENSIDAEVERAASVFDVRLANFLDSIQREAEAELKPSRTEKKDGAGDE
jgi:hypothetical protein